MAFGEVVALDDVTLEVGAGTIHGLLGHNGAGKTTLVNVLTTLLPPTNGVARVGGFDVTTQPAEVRRRIGLTGQFAAVDELLSGIDNLVLIARLLGASRRQARERAMELLEMFELRAAASRPAKTYSGGMRRRLDVAASLVGQPDVLFLDEPTSGLDPEARRGVWETLEGLVDQGTTVLLTTQYLDEADRLADAITVLAQGRVVATGTPAELKSKVGQRTVTTLFDGPGDVPRAVEALQQAGLHPAVDTAHGSVTTPVDSSRQLATIVRALDAADLEATDLRFAEPSLDDVYLALAHSATAQTKQAA
jgi:ABC-2 type transport system ATP-binding protein